MWDPVVAAASMPTPPGPDLASFLADLARAGGGGAQLQSGQRYRLDVTQLPASVANLHLDGQGATVEVTDAPDRPGTVSFCDCSFDHVVFTAPSIVNPKVPFAGFANQRNTFRDCTFVDYAPSIVWQHGRGLTFQRNRVLASDHPPPLMYSNIYCPLGDLLFQGNEMNFPPGGPPDRPATGILVGASGLGSVGQDFSNWWITDNRFLDADRPGYTVDTIVDLEAGTVQQPATLRNVWVQRNVCFNGKIDCNGGDNLWVTDNEWRITANSVGEQQRQSSMLFLIATGGSPAGVLHVERNLYVQEPTAPPEVKAQAILIVPQLHLRELHVIGNTFLINGAGTPPVPGGVIGVNLKPAANPGANLDYLEIAGNAFGFTSAPSTPGPLIAIDHPAPNAGFGLDRVVIHGNRLLGVGESARMPATVGGKLVQQFVRLGFNGHALSFGSLDIQDNFAEEGSIAGRWLATPGTLSIAKMTVRGNRPSLPPSTIPVGPSPFTYQNPDPNAVSVGLREMGGTVTSVAYLPGFGGIDRYSLPGPAAQPVILNPGDSLVVTYQGAPPALARLPA